jgi:hypothetical protein
MKPPRLMTVLSLGVICLAIGLAYAFWSHGDPCARLISLTAKVDRLQSSRPRPYRLSDHVVGVLHHSNPLLYYERQAENEKKALVASGQLVEFKIPYTADGPRSDREIAKALLAVHQRTGADYWIDFDLTNHLMLIECRPGDVGKFPVLPSVP